MDLIIKNMEMPKTCHDCPMCNDNPIGNGVILKCQESHPVFDWHEHTVRRHPSCPLEVHTGYEDWDNNPGPLTHWLED